jgi:DNA-binding MarR family transcriptional regulator
MQSVGKHRGLGEEGEMDNDDPSLLLAADRIGQEIGRLVRALTHLKRHQTDLAAAHVLAHLAETGPQRVGAIAYAVGTDPSTVSRQVAVLVAAGLVERRADPDDGRAQMLAVTEAGLRCCEEGRRKRAALLTEVLSGWPDESRQRLAELIGRFADDVQELDRQVTSRSGGET